MNPSSTDFKALGIDFGEKRIGIAISHLNGIFGTPHCILEYKNLDEACTKINEIVRNETVDIIVLGLPITMKGEIGFKAKEVIKFKELLQEHTKAEIVTEDERLTTVAALKESGGKSKNKFIDDTSATIILNNFLQKRLREL